MTSDRLQRYTVAWQTGDGRWRWAYVEETPERRELELVSHKEFLSKEEAERSAAVAYPDVLVRESEPPRSERLRHRLLVLLAVVGVCLALTVPRQRARQRARRHDRRTG